MKGTFLETDRVIGGTRKRLFMKRNDAFIKSTTAFKTVDEPAQCVLSDITDNWKHGIEAEPTS